MDAKLKHLEFIQDTINRMAKNSFLLKGWAVTVIGGLFALGFKELCVNMAYILISLTILLFFWLLDSYYLYQERLFIKLYNHVRMLPESEIDFSMLTKPFKKEIHWMWCGFSGTIGLFYGGLFLVHLIIILIA